jgi:hypothetical protein
MSSGHILSVWVKGSSELHVWITMPRRVCQPDRTGAIVGDACAGCCAWNYGRFWLWDQQMEKEQTEEIHHTNRTGAAQFGRIRGRWTFEITFDDCDQLPTNVSHYSRKRVTRIKRDAHSSAAPYCTHAPE